MRPHGPCKSCEECEVSWDSLVVVPFTAVYGFSMKTSYSYVLAGECIFVNRAVLSLQQWLTV